MATSPGTTVIFCPANRWTQVTWSALAWVRYGYTASGATVKWRRFSSGPPWYWEGSFNSSADFFFPGWVYASLEFNPNFDVTVTIRPL